MYFEIETGRIVTENDLKLAFEIYFGQKAEDVPYALRHFANNFHVRYIPASEITVERLIEGNAFVHAVKFYREQHNCTLSKAMEACDKIRNGKEVMK